MMNFQAPFPALFCMQLANPMWTSYLVSINIRVVTKGISAKASTRAGGLWVEKCGSRNQKPGLWPVLKQWVGGLSPVEHDLASLHGVQAWGQYSFPHLLKFRNFFPNKFVVSSCFLQIWTVSPRNMAILGKEITQTPLTKFAHDFVLRPWFKKIAKNKIKFHRTGRAVLFYK